MDINDLTITQRIRLLTVLGQNFGTPDMELRKQILNTFKPEPIQETKDPDPESFEIGEEVEVIDCKYLHEFKIGDRVKIVGDGFNPKYQCQYNGATWFLSPDEIKKLPKPTINKEELRKHLEHAFDMWSKTNLAYTDSINKYLETL